MSDYQLTATDIVIRTIDGAHIPNDRGNADRIEYDEWLADGGVPDPYVKPLDLTPLKIRTAAQILGATGA